MTMSGIERIEGPIRRLLREKEIIARCELLQRTYDAVRAASLSEQEKEELQGLLGGKAVAPGIFGSMMNDAPVFFNLPKLDTYAQMNGRIFHFLHTQKYSRQDFDRASRQFSAALPEIKCILQQNLKDLVADFMAQAGYRFVEGREECLTFAAGERRLRVRVFTSIKSVDVEECLSEKCQPERRPAEQEGDCIILVPSGESLEPFVQFFREKGGAAEEAGLQIWIANMEKGTIDPFIGYTTDLDIYGQFNNPRLAEMVRTNWKARE
jgi:hypothetical protein